MTTLQDKFVRLVTELASAETEMQAARERKFTEMTVYEHRGRMSQAAMSAALFAQELQRCKDNLCTFVLENHDRVRVLLPDAQSGNLEMWRQRGAASFQLSPKPTTLAEIFEQYSEYPDAAQVEAFLKGFIQETDR